MTVTTPRPPPRLPYQVPLRTPPALPLTVPRRDPDAGARRPTPTPEDDR